MQLKKFIFLWQIITILSVYGHDWGLFKRSTVVDSQLSSREQLLINHVKKCLTSVENGYRVSPAQTLQIPGGSSDKVRSLLNALCTLPQTVYLEIGLWKGSTFIPALHGNSKTIIDAVGVDNWSQFGGPKADFQKNCELFLPHTQYNYRIYSEDCFSLDKRSAFKHPVTIYFYDGGHEQHEQEQAFTYFNDILDNTFIAIVDDFRQEKIMRGTFQAFAKLGYTVLFEQNMPKNLPQGECDWWNGIYIAVIRKPQA